MNAHIANVFGSLEVISFSLGRTLPRGIGAKSKPLA